MSSYKVLDLFCGCGGLSQGFIDAGYEIVCGVDFDEKALETYKNNHKTLTLNLDLFEDRSIKKIIKSVSNNKIDIIIAGPPCQGFSLTGPRDFDDDRNTLYLSVIELVAKFEPTAFLIENVPGLATLWKGQIRAEISNRFRKLGYAVESSILNSADYGVPQVRKRIFFAGLRDDIGRFVFPIPTHTTGNYVTCEEAIGDLPGRENEIGNDVDIYTNNPFTEYQKDLRDANNILYNHVATDHKDFVKEVIAQVPEGGNYRDLPPGVGESRKFNEAWTRYHSKKPSKTIDTGHRNHFHYKYNRVPTIRENARLQSFPDSFRFYGNKTQQNRQVGDAVPPLLAYNLAMKFKKYLNKNEQKKAEKAKSY